MENSKRHIRGARGTVLAALALLLCIGLLAGVVMPAFSGVYLPVREAGEYVPPANDSAVSQPVITPETVIPAAKPMASFPNVSNEAELIAALADPDPATDITLLNNITLTASLTLTITASKTITINGGGYTITSGAFRHLAVNSSGGAVLTLILNNVVLDGAAAGGGISFTGADVGEGLVITGGVIQNCRGTNGGGIVVSGAYLSLTGCVVQSCLATGSGGGIYITNGEVILNTGAAVTNNIANGNAGGISADSTGGAGDPAKYARQNVTINGGEVSNNTAAGYAGGIWSEGAFTINSGKVSGNTGNSTGGVFVRGKFTMTGGEISGNRATAAGPGGVGVWAFPTPTLASYQGAYISGGIISNNSTAGSSGGGLYLCGTGEITGGTISGNTSASYGGGVYFAAKSIYSISNCTITGNKSGNGGGIYLYSTAAEVAADPATASVTISNTIVSNNEAALGAGIFSWDCTMVLTGSTISGNKASSNGGGIYLYKSALAPTFTISNTTISGNEAVRGGGIYTADLSTLTLTSVRFSANDATAGGSTWSVASPQDAVQTAAAAIHVTNVTGTTYTTPYTNAYNNCDVAFAIYAPTVYVVRFDSNGGTPVTPSTISVTAPQTTVGTLPPSPTRAGYVFVGWFTDAVGGTQFTASTVVTADIVVYAHWRLVSSSSSSSNGGGSSSSQAPSDRTPGSGSSSSEAPSDRTPGSAPSSSAPSSSAPSSSAPGASVSDEGTPSSIGEKKSWALFTVIFAILTLITAIICVIDYFARRGGRTLGSMLLTIIFALPALVIVFVTQDFKLPMGMFDIWSLINGICFVIVLVLFLAGKAKRQEEYEE